MDDWKYVGKNLNLTKTEIAYALGSKKFTATKIDTRTALQKKHNTLIKTSSDFREKTRTKLENSVVINYKKEPIFSLGNHVIEDFNDGLASFEEIVGWAVKKRPIVHYIATILIVVVVLDLLSPLLYSLHLPLPLLPPVQAR